MASRTFLCTFACLYKRGHNFSMPAHRDLKQKEFYSIQKSDSFKSYHKAVSVTVCSLQATYYFCYSEDSKMASFLKKLGYLSNKKVF